MLKIVLVSDNETVVVDAEAHPLSRSDVGAAQLEREGKRLADELPGRADWRFVMALHERLGEKIREFEASFGPD